MNNIMKIVASNNWFKKILENKLELGFGFFVTIGLFFRLYQNSLTPLTSWDESIYAQLGVEFARRPYFIAFYNQELWFEKSPLIAVLSALPQYFFPYNKFSIELLFTLISLVCLYMIYKLSKKILIELSAYNFNFFTKTLKASFLKYFSLIPVALVLTSSMFIQRSLIVNVDILLVFSFLGYYLFFESKYLKIFFITFGVLSKSLLGFLPLLIDLVFNHRYWIQRKNWLELTSMLIISNLWYIVAFFSYGNRFFNEHFGDHLFRRASTAIETHTGDFGYYFLQLITQSNYTGFLQIIGIVVVILGLILHFKNNFKLKLFNRNISKSDIESKPGQSYNPKNSWLWQFLCFGIIYLAIISFSQSKLEWYVLPVSIWSAFYVLILVAYVPKINQWILLPGIFIVIGLYSLYFQPLSYQNNIKDLELVTLGRCMAKQPEDSINFFVDLEERKARKELESSSQSIGSTFRYGGTPLFVYYSEKKVNFYYNIYESPENQKGSVVFSKNNLSVEQNNLVINSKSVCETANFLGFSTLNN